MEIWKESSPHRVQYHHSISKEPDATLFEKHCHDNFELLYILQGKGSFLVEGVEYEMRPNTILYAKPYEYHYVRPDASCPYERIVVNFERGVPAPEILELPFLKDANQHQRELHLHADPLGESIKTAFLDFDLTKRFSPKKGLDGETDLWLSAALTKLLLLISRVPAETGSEDSKGLIVKTMDYLNQHLDDEISLDQISKELYVSKYYLCRAFREQTGISVFDYLTTKRIVLAEQLLEEGVSATEAAYRSGFRDYSTFYRSYRKITGTSPQKRQ